MTTWRAKERSNDEWTATGEHSAARSGCRGGARTRSGDGARIGARRGNGLEGVPDGSRQPDDVVVGRAGGGGREGIARTNDRALPQEAPVRDDQDGPRDDEPARACAQ